jgi:hypothetical protein
MVGVWPAAISDISLAYKDGANEPQAITANFKYQYFYRDDELNGTQDPLNPLA